MSNRRSFGNISRGISPPATKRRKENSEVPSPAQKAFILAPEPLPPLSNKTIRIFSWNVNGIAPFLQKPITDFFQKKVAQNNSERPTASLRSFLHRHDWPHVLFLQEVKIASKDLKTQDAVKAAINARSPSNTSSEQVEPEYNAHFTLPNDPYNARGLRGNGKVYGICSIIRRDILDKYEVNVRTVDWDKEGRISVVEITSGPSKLAIFNIYAVNGTDKPYRDPVTGAIRGTRHDRKRQFHSLLSQDCKSLEALGWHVLIAGDMNVAPDARDGYPRLRTFPHQHVLNRADFHEKLLGGGAEEEEEEEGFNGVDVWREMHGDERRYTWFSRTKEWGSSCDRVDYVVAGRKGWEKGIVKAAGIMDSQSERGPSDHCPVWVDVEI